MLNPVIINTTPTAPTAGHIVVFYNWRSTTNKVVPESQKHRSILLPETLLNTPEVAALPDKFRAIIHDALTTIAGERLADYCANSNMLATTVSADIFAADSLLQWNADRKALQARLTADELKAWAPTSVTVKAAAAIYGEEVGKALADQIIKLAGPNHGLTPERANNMLAKLWKADDVQSVTGLRVQMRLQSIADSSAAQADALAAILG